ncbi:hypothetical protein VTH06DRAFT_7818 [Thermothelomyces fergusii]
MSLSGQSSGSQLKGSFRRSHYDGGAFFGFFPFSSLVGHTQTRAGAMVRRVSCCGFRPRLNYVTERSSMVLSSAVLLRRFGASGFPSLLPALVLPHFRRWG